MLSVKDHYWKWPFNLQCGKSIFNLSSFCVSIICHWSVRPAPWTARAASSRWQHCMRVLQIRQLRFLFHLFSLQ